MEVRERLDEMVAVRMPGWERFTLDQMADLTGANRSELVRHAIAALMRQAMLEHPEYALHPSWVNAGNDQWAVSLYQKWACALVADEPARHLELVTMDGITGYKLKAKGPALELSRWAERVEAHQARRPAPSGGRQ